MQTKDRDVLLNYMTYYRQLFGAIWTESIWSIADASSSETSLLFQTILLLFTTVAVVPALSGAAATTIQMSSLTQHTRFSLCSLTKVLILTNLSWIRNPYQKYLFISRPNPNLHRGAMFYVLGVQVGRMLTEQEVREINFIIKSRAWR